METQIAICDGPPVPNLIPKIRGQTFRWVAQATGLYRTARRIYLAITV
jgi:hypothetical protein